ncbi:MAG: hypothetical protein ACKPKO_00510, partial [Candidatus Fonsibacter sp.]
MTTFVDRLPPTLETIPNARILRYLRIWTETLEGMLAGSADWAMLGESFTKLLLTCFKKGEDKAKEIGFRLWYLEEGRVDELATYMKQRLLDYQGDTQTRRQQRSHLTQKYKTRSIHWRPPQIQTYSHKSTENALGKAIK